MSRAMDLGSDPPHTAGSDIGGGEIGIGGRSRAKCLGPWIWDLINHLPLGRTLRGRNRDRGAKPGGEMSWATDLGSDQPLTLGDEIGGRNRDRRAKSAGKISRATDLGSDPPLTVGGEIGGRNLDRGAKSRGEMFRAMDLGSDQPLTAQKKYRGPQNINVL